MKDVEKVVLSMIGSQSNQNQYNLFKMKARWAEIIGNNNAKHCGPVKLDRRILTLQVDSSVWSNQFLYYKSQFIRQINVFIGTDYVKDIKFVLGKEFKKNFTYTGSNSKNADYKLSVPPATVEEKEGLQLQFSYIKNDKVRNAVIGVEEKILGLEKLFNDGKIKKCPLCGAYLKNKEKICYSCERKKHEELEKIIRKKICKEPWIRWYDLQKVIKCSESEFNMVKNEMEIYYFEKIRLKTANAEEEKLGVQLKAGKPLALIKEKEFDTFLKFLQKGK